MAIPLLVLCCRSVDKMAADGAPALNAQDLVEVNLANQGLSRLPEGMDHIELIWRLNVADNKFESLDERVCKMKSLRQLILNRNERIELPPCVFTMDLELLSLLGCSLDKPPRGLEEMKTLKRLVIGGNNFSTGEIEMLRTQLPNCRIVDSVD